jgi:hypothetical protein
MGILKRIVSSKFVTWLSRSLVGNIVFAGLLTGLTTFVVFTYKSYTQGILTMDRVFYVLFIAAAESVFVGSCIWFMVTKPTMNRASKRDR